MGAAVWITPAPGGVRLDLIVVPRASRSEVVGEHEDRLKVRLKAPPVDGAANKELISFLAKLLTVPKSSLRIVSGETGRRKTLEVSGIDVEQARVRLSG
jgi:uncharacterized protein (TIGR00251 family)